MTDFGHFKYINPYAWNTAHFALPVIFPPFHFARHSSFVTAKCPCLGINTVLSYLIWSCIVFTVLCSSHLQRSSLRAAQTDHGSSQSFLPLFIIQPKMFNMLYKRKRYFMIGGLTMVLYYCRGQEPEVLELDAPPLWLLDTPK